MNLESVSWQFLSNVAVVCVCVCVCFVCSEVEAEMEFQEFKRSYLKGMNDDEDEDGNVSGGDDMAPKEK